MNLLSPKEKRYLLDKATAHVNWSDLPELTESENAHISRKRIKNKLLFYVRQSEEYFIYPQCNCDYSDDSKEFGHSPLCKVYKK